MGNRARFYFPILVLSIVLPATALPTPGAPARQKFHEIYKELVEINTTDSAGNCTAAVEAMAARLKAGGLPEKDVRLIVLPGAPKKGNLVARLQGKGSGKKPILMLAHVDVVEAKREDWERDPFKLVEENGMFYARGAADDKAMAAAFVANMIRFSQEGYRPDRDVVLALTCDEEIIPSKFNGVEYLLKNHRDLIDADLALNEGGSGLMSTEGKYLRVGIQAGEKVFQTFQLEVTNPGGHSSLPLKDNAISHLSDGLSRLGKYDFPVNLSETTRAYFDRMSGVEMGQVAADMKAILRDPPDAEAAARLSLDKFNNATMRTTCVATMLDAGHATNALPQRARATVNCRILPSESVDETEKSLVRVMADEKIRITRIGEATRSPSPPLKPDLMKAVETVTRQMWPGVPLVPTMSPGATDGRFLNNAGIPTYGLSGMFHDPAGAGAHGLNEHIRVRSLDEGQEFLYRVVKVLAGGK